MGDIRVTRVNSEVLAEAEHVEARVTRVNVEVLIEGSATPPAPPGPPQNPSAVAQSSSTILVSWDDETTETGYWVERSDNGVDGWVNVSGNLPADTVSYLDPGLTPETEYFYRVFAFNDDGGSTASAVVSDTTPGEVPPVPIDVTATAISNTQIRVDWSDVIGETGYRVERSDDGTTGWVDVSGPLAANTTSYIDGGLTPETEYFYRVVAFGPGGDSDPSSVVSATTFPTPQQIPNPAPGDAWLRHPTISALDLAVCVTETYERVRPFNAVQPIGGGLPTVVTGRPGGRNYTLVISLRSINEQRQLEDILAAPLVYYQPPCDRDLWMAPETETVVVTKIGRIRQTTVTFVETGPFPQPTAESIFEQPFPPPEEEPEEPEEP